jgi:hypothetical protein
MFKKFKSLLLAGVMALCMCGNAFAGNGNDGCHLGKAEGCVSEHKNGNVHEISNISKEQWLNYVNGYNDAGLGYQIVPQSENNGNGWHTWKVMHDCKQVEVIHVKYNQELTQEQQDAKNIPGSEPETGDASALMLLGTVALSVVGLFVLRDKKDEE